jgi:hypothetical protein
VYRILANLLITANVLRRSAEHLQYFLMTDVPRVCWVGRDIQRMGVVNMDCLDLWIPRILNGLTPSKHGG